MFFSKVVPETWSLITPFINEFLDEIHDHALAQETTAKMQELIDVIFCDVSRVLEIY